jgi:hypothetical protein
MLAYSSWQGLVTLIGLGYMGYAILALLAVIFGFFDFPYMNSFVILAMLAVYFISIPVNLNFTRRSYKVLIPWFIFHVIFVIILYAWHYTRSGIIASNGDISHSFRDGLYFSVTTWTTLGYGDFRPIPQMRLVTSIQALTALFTIPVGVSLSWFMIQESTVPYPKAYLDKNDYDESGRIKISRPDYRKNS